MSTFWYKGCQSCLDRPLPHCCWSNGPPSATRRLCGGGLVMDPTNTCDVHNLTYSAYSTHFAEPTYIHFMCFSTVHICLWESFATSTVYVLLLHVTMPSTVVLLLHATSCDSAYSTHPAQPTYIHFICFSPVPVYMNHLHVQSTFFYFMWQYHLLSFFYFMLLHATSCDSAIYNTSNLIQHSQRFFSDNCASSVPNFLHLKLVYSLNSLLCSDNAHIRVQ